MDSPGKLGGVSASEVQQIAEAMGGPPTEAGTSLDSRFVRKVADLVAARILAGEKKHFSVFLRSEALSTDIGKCACIESPLLTNGQDAISEAVWLSTASLSSAYKLAIAGADAAALFTQIRNCGFGTLPTLIVDWRPSQPIGAFYKAGLEKVDDLEPVVFEQLPITPELIKEVLDRFYERTLRTPALISEGGGNRVWEDAPKGIPTLGPEGIIQGRLCDYLKSYFTRHDVRPETTTQEGRADVVIYKKAYSQNNMPAIVNEWVLELKALCDMTSTGDKVPASKIPEAVQSGLEQATAYKDKLHAANAAVCCYDMRRNDSQSACFTHVASAAQAVGVALWRWFLFRSTAESRSAKGYV